MKIIFLQIVKSKVTFFLIFTILILSLNLTPVILHLSNTPPGRTFALIHNNTQDFFFYQALMNEGANGQWLTRDPFTGESHQPSIIFSYFLLLGKFAKLLHIPYAFIYHFFRIILGILFLLTTYYLLLTLKLPFPRLTYFFFLFASPLMHWTEEYGKVIYVPFMHWWTGMDAIRRAAYLPHHMFGALGLILSIILLIKYQQSLKKKYLIWLIFLSLLLTYIHTPSLLIILIILPPALLIYSLPSIINSIKKLPITNYQLLITNYSGLLAYWFIGLLALFLMVSQTKQEFPWSQYIDWEKKLQFPLDKELIGALGILVPLALIGTLKALLSKKFHLILIACWLITPFLFIPFAEKLGLSNIRLIQGAPYLPLSILAILGISTIQSLIHNFLAKNPKLLFTNYKLLFNCSIIVLFIIFTYPTLSWSLKDQIREFMPIFGNVYLDNRLNSAFSFINQNFPPKTLTLGTFYTGNYLPAFTHTISFIGHSGYTYNVEEKQKLTARFFESKMTPEEAKSFLKQNKIALIFQGPEEKPLYNNLLYPKILKPVYKKEEVTLYIPL